MGISTIPVASSGGIKSVQRGSAASSGNVTITSVNIAKSFVTVYGTASSGSSAVSGGTNTGTSSLTVPDRNIVPVNNSVSSGTPYFFSNNNWLNNLPYSKAPGWNASANNSAVNFTGGSNNLVTAVVQGYLSDSTTLVVSGACRWEVVEFN